MVVDELFLNCPIKPFHMGIHLGGSGIGMPVVLMESPDLKCFIELRAIVGEQFFNQEPERHKQYCRLVLEE
jgi:hypothetical protein